MATLRIVLADDDAPFRQQLRLLLVGEPGVELVGEAADGVEAVRLVAALAPDLLLVDLAMPGVNGIVATERALAVQPGLKVLMISLHDDRRMVTAALAAGASGYVLKDHLDLDLAPALAAVGRGETFRSAALGA